MDILLAIFRGYQDRQLDAQCLSVLTGYWAAYYTNGGKKAKKPSKIIQEMRKSVQPQAEMIHDDTVQSFEELEALFNSKLQGGDYLSGK